MSAGWLPARPLIQSFKTRINPTGGPLAGARARTLNYCGTGRAGSLDTGPDGGAETRNIISKSTGSSTFPQLGTYFVPAAVLLVLIIDRLVLRQC